MPDGTIPDLVVRSDALLLRAVREATREVDFVASTDAIDSYDEVIDQTTWRLDRFKANPVILYAHQSSDLPIGQATRCEVVGGQLEVTIQFATADANPKAEMVWKLVQQKILRAVSVGFKPMDGHYELRDGKEIYLLSNCDLREVSIVSIPANPECLAKMKAASPRAKQANETKITERSVEGASTKEFEMNEKELREALDKSEKALIESRTAEKAATDKANAEAAKAAATADKVRALETELATAKAEKTTLDGELAKASTDRDTATKRADEAEAKLIELEVDALVGKKITAAEKADFVTMRTKLPETFKSVVEKRPDLKLTEQVTQDDTKAVKSVPNGAIPASDAAAAYFAKL